MFAELITSLSRLIGALRQWMVKLILVVDFSNILLAAFAHEDPKREKDNNDLTFALLGPTGIKALRKHVGEIDPW